MHYTFVVLPVCESAKARSERPSSGFIQKAMMEPRKRRPMLPRKGSCQLPVLSMTKPATVGERMAARAEPLFIRPLAVPENFGAMSMGMAHMGPMVNSEKKKAELRQRAATLRSWMKTIGSMKASE